MVSEPTSTGTSGRLKKLAWQDRYGTRVRLNKLDLECRDHMARELNLDEDNAVVIVTIDLVHKFRNRGWEAVRKMVPHLADVEIIFFPVYDDIHKHWSVVAVRPVAAQEDKENHNMNLFWFDSMLIKNDEGHGQGYDFFPVATEIKRIRQKYLALAREELQGGMAVGGEDSMYNTPPRTSGPIQKQHHHTVDAETTDDVAQSQEAQEQEQEQEPEPEHDQGQEQEPEPEQEQEPEKEPEKGQEQEQEQEQVQAGADDALGKKAQQPEKEQEQKQEQEQAGASVKPTGIKRTAAKRVVRNGKPVYTEDELQKELGSGPYVKALMEYFKLQTYARIHTNKSNEEEVRNIEANLAARTHLGESRIKYLVRKQKKYPRPHNEDGETMYWLVRVKTLQDGSKVTEEMVRPNSQLGQAVKYGKQDCMQHQKPFGAGQLTLKECAAYMKSKCQEEDLAYNRAQGHIGTWPRRARLCDLVNVLVHHQTATSKDGAEGHVCSMKRLHKLVCAEWANISREIVKAFLVGCPKCATGRKVRRKLRLPPVTYNSQVDYKCHIFQNDCYQHLPSKLWIAGIIDVGTKRIRLRAVTRADDNPVVNYGNGLGDHKCKKPDSAFMAKFVKTVHEENVAFGMTWKQAYFVDNGPENEGHCEDMLRDYYDITRENHHYCFCQGNSPWQKGCVEKIGDLVKKESHALAPQEGDPRKVMELVEQVESNLNEWPRDGSKSVAPNHLHKVMRHIQEGDVCEAHEEWQKRDTERKRTRGLVSAEEQVEFMDGEEEQMLVKRVRGWSKRKRLKAGKDRCNKLLDTLVPAEVKEGSKVWWIIPSNTKRGKSVKRKYVDVAKLRRLPAVVLERVEGDKVSGTSFHLVLQWGVLSPKQNGRNIKALQGPVEESDPGGRLPKRLHCTTFTSIFGSTPP
eukprot:g12873.t1